MHRALFPIHVEGLKVLNRVYKIITKASRHMFSMYAYSTPLQHNIIRIFYAIRPTNDTVSVAFFGNTVKICLLSFLSTLIYQQIYAMHPRLFVFHLHIRCHCIAEELSDA